MKNSILTKRTQNYFGKTPRDVLEKEALMRILNNTWYGMGPYVITDENEIREQNKEAISPLLKELNEFLNNASEEELKRNWEDLKQWENVGPNARDFVKRLEEYV